MDDVVGTGPEEHLMSDFEHMKTSLYLTDVVVLRHEGDTVNFLGVEITKTSKGLEVKNSTDLVELLFESLRVGQLETDNQSWQTFDSDGARVSNSSGWSCVFQLSHSRRKTHLHGILETDMQFAIQQLSTQVLNPTIGSKRAVKQRTRYLKGTHNTCLRLELYMSFH